MYFFIICVLLIAVIAFQQWMHQREKKDLHNRLMSRDYPEYQHFDTVHQIQAKAEEERLKNLNDQKKKEAEARLTPEELKKKEAAEGM